MRYLDTSLVVAALTQEPKTAAVQQWMTDQIPGTLIISEWVATEVSAALSIKLRTGTISAEDRIGSRSAFAQLKAVALMVVPVTREHFRAAAFFADRADLRLKAGDALHLAIAQHAGASLATLDKQQSAAATDVGLEALLL